MKSLRELINIGRQRRFNFLQRCKILLQTFDVCSMKVDCSLHLISTGFQPLDLGLYRLTLTVKLQTPEKSTTYLQQHSKKNKPT